MFARVGETCALRRGRPATVERGEDVGHIAPEPAARLDVDGRSVLGELAMAVRLAAIDRELAERVEGRTAAQVHHRPIDEQNLAREARLRAGAVIGPTGCPR